MTRRDVVRDLGCLLCGEPIKRAQGYVVIEARDYAPLLPFPVRPIMHFRSHKKCFKAWRHEALA